MVTASATINNAFGIHVRPAAIIARELREYAGILAVACPGGEPVDPKNILGLISLGLTCGQNVDIRVDGPEAETMAARLVELLQARYDFPR